VVSRRAKALTGAFPEVVRAVSAHLPVGTVLDVRSFAGRRAGWIRCVAAPPQRRATLAEQYALAEPAHFVVFDVLRSRVGT